MSVAVIVPTYNEAASLRDLSTRLFDLPVPHLRLIVVDDNSPDGTGELAERLAAELGERVEVIHREYRQGIASAYISGFRHALESSADYIVQMDADLSHPPEDIPLFLEELKRADVVVGSRYTPGGGAERAWGLSRRLLSYMGNLYIRQVAGLKVRDATSGFKGFRRAALEGLDLDSFRCRGFAFQAEVAYACQKRGYRIVEHPIRFAQRARGESKISLGIIVEALWRLLPLRWRR